MPRLYLMSLSLVGVLAVALPVSAQEESHVLTQESANDVQPAQAPPAAAEQRGPRNANPGRQGDARGTGRAPAPRQGVVRDPDNGRRRVVVAPRVVYNSSPYRYAYSGAYIPSRRGVYGSGYLYLRSSLLLRSWLRLLRPEFRWLLWELLGRLLRWARLFDPCGLRSRVRHRRTAVAGVSAERTGLRRWRLRRHGGRLRWHVPVVEAGIRVVFDPSAGAGLPDEAIGGGGGGGAAGGGGGDASSFTRSVWSCF